MLSLLESITSGHSALFFALPRSHSFAREVKNALEPWALSTEQVLLQTAGVIFAAATYTHVNETQKFFQYPTYPRPYRYAVRHSIHLCSYLTRIKYAKHNYVNAFSFLALDVRYIATSCLILAIFRLKNWFESLVTRTVDRMFEIWKEKLWQMCVYEAEGICGAAQRLCVCVSSLFFAAALFVGHYIEQRASEQFDRLFRTFLFFHSRSRTTAATTATKDDVNVISWTETLASRTIFMVHAIWMWFFCAAAAAKCVCCRNKCAYVPIADKYCQLC